MFDLRVTDLCNIQFSKISAFFANAQNFSSHHLHNGTIIYAYYNLLYFGSCVYKHANKENRNISFEKHNI